MYKILFIILLFSTQLPQGFGELNEGYSVLLRRSNNVWKEEINENSTALIICDMWNAHPCKKLADRSPLLAKKIDAFANKLRKKGTLIIHAPAEVVKNYESHPQRIQTVKYTSFSSQRYRKQPEPIHSPVEFLGSYTCTCPTKGIWKKGFYSCENGFLGIGNEANHIRKQTNLIGIHENDLISETDNEIFPILKKRNINTVFIVGVHSNICVLRRPFGVLSLIGAGFNVILIRDLVDAEYVQKNSKQKSVDEANELMACWYEDYLCPTASYEDF